MEKTQVSGMAGDDGGWNCESEMSLGFLRLSMPGGGEK